MSSWSRGFIAGCSTVLAAAMLISVLMLPSFEDIMGAAQNYGSSIVSAVFDKDSRIKVKTEYVEFLSADSLEVLETADLSLGSNGFDGW